MRSYTGLIPRGLKAHPQRSLLTLTSITLAVAMIAAVGVLATSLQATQVRQAIDLSGNLHGTIKDLTPAQLENLRAEPGLEALGVSAPLGAHTAKSVTLTIEGFDETAIDMFGLQLAEGRFPAAVDEIALEAWMIEQLDPTLKPGDRLALPYQGSFFDSAGELHSWQGQAEFTLVGVLQDITAAQVTSTGLGLITPQAAVALLPAGQLRYTGFVRFPASAVPGAEESLQRIGKAIGVDPDQVSGNRFLLIALQSGAEARLPVMLLAGLVLVAAGLAIYNIFHIGVVERMRQFGILRALGATSAQICQLVIGEGLALCALAVPLGLALGVGAAWLLAVSLKILHSQIGALVVSAESLAAAGGVGLLATLLSALFPALAAARIPPLVAIRGPHVGLVERQARRPKWVGRASMPVRLAGLNLWRNPRRSLLTIVSLGMGVALFIAFSAYATGMDPASLAKQYLNGEYAVTTSNFQPSVGFSADAAAQIEALPGVERVIKTQVGWMGYALLPDDRISPEMAERLRGPLGQGGEVQKTFGEPGFTAVPYELFGYESGDLARLKGLVMEGELDPQAMAEEPILLVVDPEEKSGLQVGDTLTLKRTELGAATLEIHEMTFTIGAVLKDTPVHLGYGSVGPQLVAHSRFFVDFYGADVYKRFDVLMNNLDQANVVEARLEQLAAQAEGGVFLSYTETLEKFAREKREISLLFYSLVGIVSLIGVSNMINTLTTNLILRTRELGMLRAVGMTPPQLGAMTRLEGLFYGLFSALAGAVGGISVAVILVRVMQAQGSPVSWQSPWLALLLAVLASLGLGVLVTLRPSQRIAKMAVVEALKSID